MGRIEPASGVIQVSAPSGDRIGRLLIAEGQTVSKGRPLLELASRRMKEIELAAIDHRIAEARVQRDAESALADARIAASRAAVAQAKAGQFDIEAQTENIGLLEANLRLAKNDSQRLAGLSKELVSPQQLEQQSLLVLKAEAQLNAGQKQLAKISRGYQVNVAAAEADLAAAMASKQQVIAAIAIESLKSNRELLALQLEETIVKAPCDGTILKIQARQGEAIGVRPIVQLADLSRLVVIAEVYQSEVKLLAAGQTVRITSRAFRRPWDEQGIGGTLGRIGQIIARPGLASLDPTARADRRVVEVTVEIDGADAAEASRLINLQVDVMFLPADKTSRASKAKTP